MVDKDYNFVVEKIGELVEIFLIKIDVIFFPPQLVQISNISKKAIRLLKDSKDGKIVVGILATNPDTGFYSKVGTCITLEKIDGEMIEIRISRRFDVSELKLGKSGVFEVEAEIVVDKELSLAELAKNNSKLYEYYKKTMMRMEGVVSDFPERQILDKYPVGELADRLATYLLDDYFIRQDILDTLEVEDRLEKVLSYLNSEIDRRILIKNLDGFEHLEQGRGFANNSDVEKFRKIFAGIKDTLVPEARDKIEKQLELLARIPVNQAGYDYIFRWLDFALGFYSLKPTQDNPDFDNVRKVLENNHFGLEKIKKRIFEELVVRQLKPDKRGPILCFVGPPGTGKTSIARAIAESLGRKFVSLSLGGVNDVAEIRGHRITYVGATAGGIVENINRSGASNPVFVLDEIDKTGEKGAKADVAAALLEVLDPEQNYRFKEHYLDVPTDFSRVMFITTANILDTIPPALLDRMEVIKFSGYTFDEKIAIAKKILTPRQKEENGINVLSGYAEVSFKDEAVADIIEFYASGEAGVRNLEREIGTVLRKIAISLCLGKSEMDIVVDSKNLRKILGPPKRLSKKLEETPVGVATGVAVTQRGGEILFVEAVVVNKEGNGKLKLTGKLADVIKESGEAALSFLRSHCDSAQEKRKSDLHIHIPEGAVSKDGPSSGVAFVSALYSLFENKPIKKGLVMTGEITLSGKVLPVGGVKEKFLAALRAGATEFILPSDNKKDLKEIAPKIKKQMKIHLVKTIQEVLTIIFE
ncbi:endopeptidase La [Patescibacteria group bacterium]|nr:endopeptidase La [Patescibacteria group bacterium]